MAEIISFRLSEADRWRLEGDRHRNLRSSVKGSAVKFLEDPISV